MLFAARLERWEAGQATASDIMRPQLALELLPMFAFAHTISEFSALLKILSAELAQSAAVRRTFMAEEAFEKLACLLQYFSNLWPDATGEAVEIAVQELGNLFRSIPDQDGRLKGAAFWYFIGNFELWAYGSADFQLKLIELVAAEIIQPMQFSGPSREAVIKSLVHTCSTCFWEDGGCPSSIPDAVEMRSTPSARPAMPAPEATVKRRPGTALVRALRLRMFGVVETMIEANPTEGGLKPLLDCMLCCKDSGVVGGVLELLLRLCGTRISAAVLELMNQLDGLLAILTALQRHMNTHATACIQLATWCIGADAGVVESTNFITSAAKLIATKQQSVSPKPLGPEVQGLLLLLADGKNEDLMPVVMRSVFLLAGVSDGNSRKDVLALVVTVALRNDCEALLTVRGWERMVLECVCSDRTAQEGGDQIQALAVMMSKAVVSGFCKEGHTAWKNLLGYISYTVCTSIGPVVEQTVVRARQLHEGLYRNIFSELEAAVSAQSVPVTPRGPLWTSLCYFLIRENWPQTVDSFCSVTKATSSASRAQVAGQLKSLLKAIWAKFEEKDQIHSMNISFESVYGRTIFDAVLLNTIQALLMSRDMEVLSIVESLFQLELDSADPLVQLVEGKLAFCVTNLLKCLSREARLGRVPADPLAADFDSRVVAILSDVLVCRWDSIARHVVAADGKLLLTDQEAPHEPVADFVRIMFGAEFKEFLGRLGALALETAKQLGKPVDDFNLMAVEGSLDAEQELAVAGSRSFVKRCASLAVLRSETEEGRLSTAMGRAHVQKYHWASCDSWVRRVAAEAVLLQGASQDAFWESDLTELPDHSRVRLRRSWSGHSHAAAARLTETPPELVSAFESYDTLLEQMRTRRQTLFDPADPVHFEHLHQFWASLMPGHAQPVAVSKEWLLVGFQNDQPASDFRAMGLLAAENLAYFATTYTEEAQRMNQAPHFPLAIIGINVTGWLLALLETHVLSPDHFDNGFSPAHCNELYSAILRRFIKYWEDGQYTDVMQFTTASETFLEQKIRPLAASGKLVDKDEVFPESGTTEMPLTLELDEEQAYIDEMRERAEVEKELLEITSPSTPRDEFGDSLADVIRSPLPLTVAVGAAKGAAVVAETSIYDSYDSYSQLADTSIGDETAGKKIGRGLSSLGKMAGQKRAEALHKAQEKAHEAAVKAQSGKVLALEKAHEKKLAAMEKARETQKRVEQKVAEVGERVASTVEAIGQEAAARAEVMHGQHKQPVVGDGFYRSKVEAESLWENERCILGKWRSSNLLPCDFAVLTDQVPARNLSLFAACIHVRCA